MVDTVATETSQLPVVAVINFQTAGLETSGLYSTVVLTSTTPEIEASAVFLPSVVKYSPDVETSALAAVVVARGRVSNPLLNPWAFTLDGHDFVVFNLGTEEKTLVYDLSTQQWSHFSTEGLASWRVRAGFNWKTSGNVAHEYGSNVIVGDDSTGTLWVLNPRQGYDEAPRDPALTVPFPRSATGQVITRGRQFIPIYDVYLTASGGAPAVSGSSVSLLYSDDRGNNYVNAGAQVANEGEYNQEFAWRSLGLVRAPGRLFRIEDDGAFARIDGLDVNFATTP